MPGKLPKRRGREIRRTNFALNKEVARQKAAGSANRAIVQGRKPKRKKDKVYPKAFGVEKHVVSAGRRIIGITENSLGNRIHWYTDRRIKKGKIADRKKK
ncbi:MAG: hypothetical protein ABH986_03130 [archaeon]